jgi:methylthioribose-1-phosphate isomerase
MAQSDAVQQQLESIKYSGADKPLLLLDQRVLPLTVKFDEVDTIEMTHQCIKEMRVRGAPAIAITAALGIAVAATKKRAGLQTVPDAASFLATSLDYVGTSRPTAVNMFNAIAKLKGIVAAEAAREGSTGESVLAAFVAEAERMWREDIAFNEGIMRKGATYIEELVARTFPGDERQLNVMTICNTGALATARFGTALGVIRELHYRRHLAHVFPLETRPWNQGARLTVFECMHEGIPATLIVDSAVAALMSSKRVHAVIVGADRICRNGDTANKIGTCNVAVVAKHFGVPFFVAAPSTTLDPKTLTGAAVEIEQRGVQEITHVDGKMVIASGPTIDVWNPVFDITPAALITGGIITEKGVLPPDAAGKFDITTVL